MSQGSEPRRGDKSVGPGKAQPHRSDAARPEAQCRNLLGEIDICELTCSMTWTHGPRLCSRAGNRSSRVVRNHGSARAPISATTRGPHGGAEGHAATGSQAPGLDTPNMRGPPESRGVNHGIAAGISWRRGGFGRPRCIHAKQARPPRTGIRRGEEGGRQVPA